MIEDVIIVRKSEIQKMIKKGKVPHGHTGLKDAEYNVLAMSPSQLIKHIEGLLRVDG